MWNTNTYWIDVVVVVFFTLAPIIIRFDSKGVTSRGWFVSEVQGGDRRTTHGTRDGFQSPNTWGEVGRWIRTE